MQRTGDVRKSGTSTKPELEQQSSHYSRRHHIFCFRCMPKLVGSRMFGGGRGGGVSSSLGWVPPATNAPPEPSPLDATTAGEQCLQLSVHRPPSKPPLPTTPAATTTSHPDSPAPHYRHPHSLPRRQRHLRLHLLQPSMLHHPKGQARQFNQFNLFYMHTYCKRTMCLKRKLSRNQTVGETENG